MKILQPIVIDTDAGHDDALALILLERSGLFDIKAITTVAGNSTLDNVTRNAQAVMDLLGDKVIPIYSGSDAPLERPLIKAVVHGESGLDGLDMSRTKYNLSGDAIEKMIEIVAANPGKISILAIGPLTNIARCIKKDLTFAANVKQLVIMGGAIDVPGNKSRVAEFNIFVDPEAADVVFKSSIRKVLVPLDPCNEAVLNINVFDALRGSTLYEPLRSMMEHFISGIKVDEGVEGALVYDAIAAYYLVNPAAFQIVDMYIAIETRGEHTSGMTVVEKRLGRVPTPNVRVVVQVDIRVFTNDLLGTIRQNR
jgi:inosine-uridine nucleoside N-ribohydrolase